MSRRLITEINTDGPKQRNGTVRNGTVASGDMASSGARHAKNEETNQRSRGDTYIAASLGANVDEGIVPLTSAPPTPPPAHLHPTLAVGALASAGRYPPVLILAMQKSDIMHFGTPRHVRRRKQTVLVRKPEELTHDHNPSTRPPLKMKNRSP